MLDERPEREASRAGQVLQLRQLILNPFTLQLTDTVDGAQSGGYAGSLGNLTGQVHVAAGMATITLAGHVTLAP